MYRPLDGSQRQPRCLNIHHLGDTIQAAGPTFDVFVKLTQKIQRGLLLCFWVAKHVNLFALIAGTEYLPLRSSHVPDSGLAASSSHLLKLKFPAAWFRQLHPQEQNRL
ncbi:MAG: hypothetical protein R3C56_35630 [Pirellulaceae bacterium]